VRRILIIEDVPMNRDLLVQLLEDRYELIEAEDGEQGLLLAAREQPDLILPDMSLPGMDGWEVARRLRADVALAAIPIVACTAHAMAGDAERALAAGCSGYLAKPIDEEQLWELVARLLGG